jgi:hypothetical protein
MLEMTKLVNKHLVISETGEEPAPKQRVSRKKTKPDKVSIVGDVGGIDVGTTFQNRKALCEARVHNMTMHGISTDGLSIVLSGGYVDDVDDGDEVIYTGEGGRDSKSGRQIADQQLIRGNCGLNVNIRLRTTTATAWSALGTEKAKGERFNLGHDA